jgi:cytidine deaminase
MTKYLSDKPFTVAPGGTKTYRENYDRIFGKKCVPCGVCEDCLAEQESEHIEQLIDEAEADLKRASE